jgi:hypothetical protein
MVIRTASGLGTPLRSRAHTSGKLTIARKTASRNGSMSGVAALRPAITTTRLAATKRK